MLGWSFLPFSPWGLVPSVLSPSWKVVVSSLGLGKVLFPVFVAPLAFCLLYPLRLFSQFLEVISFGYDSGDLQAVLLLSLTPGVAAPCLSISVPVGPALLWAFGGRIFVLSSLFRLRVPFFGFLLASVCCWQLFGSVFYCVVA